MFSEIFYKFHESEKSFKYRVHAEFLLMFSSLGIRMNRNLEDYAHLNPEIWKFKNVKKENLKAT